jgi:hypothetical protein
MVKMKSAMSMRTTGTTLGRCDMGQLMRIKCAGIRYQGKVYEGRRHHEIGMKMIADGVCPRPYPSLEDDQGFVTECGRFVMRIPAMAIAIRAGQVKEGETCHPRMLFSEDLNL